MATASFLWYDLETFGLNAGQHPVAQFGALRTDTSFKILDEINLLCRIPIDLLPDPASVKVHKISPLQLVGERARHNQALSESEFAARIHTEINRPGTCSVGYNSIAFDNSHLRYLFYRNLREPYHHEYKDNCTKWDLLNVLRLVSVLQADAFRLPYKSDDQPSYALSDLAKENNLSGISHDALVDTRFLCSMAKLVQKNAPNLFDFCLEKRSKEESKDLLQQNSPLLHFSSRFPRKYHSGSIIYPLPSDQDAPKTNTIYSINLRHSPQILLDLSPQEIAERIITPQNELDKQGLLRPPIKGIRINRCPILYPLQRAWAEDKKRDIFKRLALDLEQTRAYWLLAERNKKELEKKTREAFAILNKRDRTPTEKSIYRPPEERLYDDFWGDEDAASILSLHSAPGEEGVQKFEEQGRSFKDARLNELFIHYKGRNFPHLLQHHEKQLWDKHCQRITERDLPKVLEDLQELQEEDPQNELLKETEAYYKKHFRTGLS